MVDLTQNPQSQKISKKERILYFLIALFVGLVVCIVFVIFNRGSEKTAAAETQATQNNSSYDFNAEQEANRILIRGEGQKKVVEDIKPNTTYTPPPRSSLDEYTERYLQQLKEQQMQAYISALNSSTSIARAGDIYKSDRNTDYPGKSSNTSEELMDRAMRMQERALNANNNSELMPNMQKEKQQWLNQQHKFTYSAEQRNAALSDNEVKAGSIIPAVLINGINSDLPGMLIAQVTQDIRDSKTGANILIPKGSKLLGSYDSQIAWGQTRLLVVWNRIQFPDASIIHLGNMGGVDSQGLSGFKDKVNNHYFKAFSGAILMAIIGAGVSPKNKNDSDGKAYKDSVAEDFTRELAQLGKEIARKNLNIQPTLEIRQGFKFNVLVNQDLILPIYQ